MMDIFYFLPWILSHCAGGIYGNDVYWGGLPWLTERVIPLLLGSYRDQQQLLSRACPVLPQIYIIMGRERPDINPAYEPSVCPLLS
jgi:hypothetical protein